MSVVIETTLGDITVDLYLDQRPVTCLNFLKLCKMKYYNYNLFHTIRSGFIAQTGDPSGEGSGGQSIFGLLEGPEKRYFSGEKMPKIRHTDTGLLSMVGTGDVMIGSQFFFTLGSDLDSLDGYHCVIGEVTEGHEVLRKLNDVICDETHRPYQDVRVTHTVVLEDPFNDPTGFRAPSRSPSPSAERLKGGRIAPDEELDEAQGRSAEEIQEIIEEKEAKARATILEIVGDIPDADIAPPENVLFVCKLNPVTTDDDLEIIFSRFGKINSCEVIRDKKTGDSLQYAFIEFDDKKSCESAYFKMDNVLIDDRRIHVDFSQSVSKIKWLGKGRGVKHITEEEDDHVSKNKKTRPRSKDRDHRERDRDRHNDIRTHDRDRRDRGHSRDRKSREERVSRHHKEHRERSKSNSHRHREEKQLRNRKEHKDRSRSRSKDGHAKDRTSKHASNHSNYNESQRSDKRKDDNKKKHQEQSKDRYDCRSHKSKSEKSPIRNERSISNKSPSKHNKDKPNNNDHNSSGKHNFYQNSNKNNSRNQEITYKNSEKEIESNNRNVENLKLKHRSSTTESQNLEPRTPSPKMPKKVDNNKSKEDRKEMKSKKTMNKVVKKKRKPSTSSDSDSSGSSSSSSDSSSSSESDHKKKHVKRNRRHSTSSSSTSDSSSSSSSSSDSSSSSSDSEPKNKKRKSNKKKIHKNDKKKS